MSNRDCENFRESMNTEPIRENDNNTISGWRNGTQSSNNNTINGKVLVRFDYELDPKGPKSYYDNKNKECFKRPETMDPEL